MAKSKIKKDDMVVVISGADKNKRGKVMEVQRSAGKVLVEGVNLRKRTMRRSQERPEGGIVDREQPIHMSNVMELSRYQTKVEPKNSNSSKQEAAS